jgi:hypothetical protein
METWYHAVLEAGDRSYAVPLAADGLASTPRHQCQIERFRLLSTLGQALRRQQATLDTAGLVSPAHLGSFEPGAIGHLIALQIRVLASATVSQSSLSNVS